MAYQVQNKKQGVVPRYHVHLDAHPSVRWRNVIADYKDHFKSVESIILDLIKEHLGKTGLFLKSLLSLTMAGLTKCGLLHYGEELKSIAKQTNMSLGLIVVMQLIYEGSAHCTSIVCNDKNGKPIHIRTMDWEMEFLRPMTIEVEFLRNNKPVCIATTWAGYIGIFTGMRLDNKGFSISVNFRVTGDEFWDNLKNFLKKNWPIGFLVRETLTQKNTDFNQAKERLIHSELIAPVYFTMSGFNKNEGCLITRDRVHSINPLQLGKNDEMKENGDRKFIVQTNIDHWDDNPDDDIMLSTWRRSVAKSRLKSMNGIASRSDLWNLASQYPLCNEITVYGTLMSVSHGFLETRLPHQKYQFYEHDKNDIDDADKLIKCRLCGKMYYDSLNAKGECKHTGTWHSTYGDCNTIACAYGLGLNISNQHWSCCFAVEKDSKCTKSGKHQP